MEMNEEVDDIEMDKGHPMREEREEGEEGGGRGGGGGGYCHPIEIRIDPLFESGDE